MLMACVCGIPTRAAAQETFEHSAWSVSNDAQAKSVSELPKLSVRMVVPAGGMWQTAVRQLSASRGMALPAMYVSLIGLQVYDGYSTTTGLSHGAVESNGFMSAAVNHRRVCGPSGRRGVRPSTWRSGPGVSIIGAGDRPDGRHERRHASVAVSNASYIHAQK
jgi:hypothetical protein